MNNYYRMDGWVKTTLGPAVPGAQVYVCTQPANVFPPITPPKTLPVPWAGPNPQAPIFSDAGLTPIIQPILTDGFGHYDFYVTPGLYTIVVLFGGKVQQFYVDQSLGNAGSISISPLVLSTNGTPNFNQTALNFIQGSGITLSTDNFGNMTITGNSSITLQTNEVPNVSQTLLDLHASTGISLIDNGAGRVTITNTAPFVAQPVLQTFGYKVFVDNTSPIAVPIGTVALGTGDISATTGVAPTTTEPGYKTENTGAAGSAASTIWAEGTLASTGPSGIPTSSIQRFATLVKLNTKTNMRCYVGFATPVGGGIQTAFITDTPNTKYIFFRYSSTVDGTTWHAVCGTSSGSQSVVDTTVPVNTSVPQELVFTYDGVTLLFSVDGSTPVNLNTNIPAGPTRLTGSIDNHNQATACTCSWSYLLYSIKI